MKYEPRLTTPGSNNKYWLHTSAGGLNSCILIKGKSVLPNCVGYAWGRFYELLGSQPKLSRGNAENWYGYIKDGYDRGQEPKLGAVICWRKGQAGNSNDGAGHVAIVEKINKDGSIVTSNSAYSGTRFYLRTMKKPYFLSSAYTFQGFIYNPAVKEEVPTPIKKTNEEIAKEVIKGIWGNGEERKTKLNLAGYNFTEIQKIVNDILKAQKPVEVQTIHVGDKVEITGTGNASSWGRLGKAQGIGYQRFIKRIWVGRPYPYQVGNEKGTTGFYKETAIKKI